MELPEVPVQKASTDVAKKPNPRLGLEPIEETEEKADHDPNLYGYMADNDPYVKEFFEQDVLPRYMRENPNATQQELDAIKKAYTYKQSITSGKRLTGS